MDQISIVKSISELMGNHGVPYHTENEWVVPFGNLPAIRAIWYPREHNGLLEVDVLLEDKRIINAIKM